MEYRSFLIPVVNKKVVENQIAKLNKRAARIGIDPIELKWGKAFMDRRQIVIPNLNNPDEEQIFDEEILSIPLEVSGPINVSHDGWMFVATIQHLSTGENIVRSISDEIDIPKKYRNVKSDCDHCKTRRYRKDTYLIWHDKGDLVQVGSTCIKDFLGDSTPENIINRANFVAELFTFLEGSIKTDSLRAAPGSGIDMDELIHIDYFLAHTIAEIRDHGWLSKSLAKQKGGISTADLVQQRIFNGNNYLNWDMDEAQKASDWAENLSDDVCDDSDYLFNIRAIARTGMVGVRTFGFAASIIPAYRKSITTKVSESKHVGSVKQRSTFKLKLVKRFTFGSMYGVQNKYIFNDKDGNVFTWTTSSDQFMNENGQYSIIGTIKRHTEFKGTPQTELTRCKVLN